MSEVDRLQGPVLADSWHCRRFTQEAAVAQVLDENPQLYERYRYDESRPAGSKVTETISPEQRRRRTADELEHERKSLMSMKDRTVAKLRAGTSTNAGLTADEAEDRFHRENPEWYEKYRATFE